MARRRSSSVRLGASEESGLARRVRWLAVSLSLVLEAALIVPLTAADAAASAGVEQTTAIAPELVAARPDRTSAQLTARLQGSRVEVLGERSETTLVFANPDGTFTEEAYSTPVRMRSADGSWVQIDATLTTGRDGEIRTRATPADLEFSAGGSGPFARLSAGSKSVGVRWPASLPAPVLSENTATYRNVVPNGDLVVSALPSGFSHSLVLRQRPTGPLEVRLPIDLAGGLELQRTTDRRLQLRDGTKILASAPAPRMWDAVIDPLSRDPVNTMEVATSIEAGADGPVLVLRPDNTFLTGATYPVTIDPTFASSADTWVQFDDYLSSQYTSTELKAGSYDGVEKARSFLKFSSLGIVGKQILDTELRLYNYYSSTCSTSGDGVQVRRITQDWTSTTLTWSNQPTTTATGAVTIHTPYGYDASCPADYVRYDIDAIVQAWADGSSIYGLQIRAVTETDALSWRRYRSSEYVTGDHYYEPHLTVTYNSLPSTPTSLMIAPQFVNPNNSVRYVTSNTPTVSAVVTDPDGGNVKAQFEVSTTGGTVIWTGTSGWVASGAMASMPTGSLAGQTNLRVRARGYDGTSYSTSWTGYTTFTMNTGVPAAPSISCPGYPQGVWTTPVPGGVSCTLDTTSSDGWGYDYWLDTDPVTQWRDIDATGGDPRTITIDPAVGWHTLSAKTVDQAGLISSVTTYSFGVGGGDITSPAEGDRTQDAVLLTATSPQSSVTYEYRIGVDDALPFAVIPTANVYPTGSGTPIPSWPQATSAQLDWRVAATVVGDGAVQTRACFTPGGFCTEPVTITLERTAFGVSYATDDLGPGSVALLTGDFSVSEADVSFGELAVGRTHTTLAPAASGVFGPGWVASLPGPEGAGAASFTFEDHSASGFVLLVGTDGQTLTYLEQPDGTFVGVGDAVDGSVITKDSATQFTLKDTEGTTTTWVYSGTAWGVSQIVGAPTEGATSFVRDGFGRVTHVIAPSPAGVTCTAGSLVAGCRALVVTYAAATTATGTAEAQWGDYAGQIKTVDYTAYDPALPGMRTVAVASYLYDNTGHLRAAWDPRISPTLKTRYTYDLSGRLATITPPGLNGWTLAYDTSGRLAHVTRTDPVHGAATQAVVYNVPISGTGAPIDLSFAATATWAQTTDLPRVGGAVFPASHVPPRNGTTGAYEPAAGDWKYASLTYLDVNGRTVNTAAFGAGAWQLDTTRWDEFGNVVWQLDGGNRAQALVPTSSTDPYVAGRSTSMERADLLATISTYTTDGADLLTSLGPTHPVMLQSGLVASARTRTTNIYDQGKPNSDTYHLVTTSTTEPVVVDGSGTAGEEDQRITINAYDPIDGASATGPTSGWVLRRATIIKTVFPGTTPNIEHKIQFDDAGRPVETRMPAASGTTPAKTSYLYFTAGGHPSNPSCGNRPEWAGLACKVFPKGQSNWGPEIPTRNYTYTMDSKPDTLIERRPSTGAVVRTTDINYDAAGRVSTVAVTTTTEVPSTSVPTMSHGYSATTGLPATMSDGTRTITTGYDALGQVTSYTDADGNISTSTYTIDGQVATASDGKGTTAYTYDGNDALGREERRGLVTSVDNGMGAAADIFTGAYDPNGALVQQKYPNGLIATSVFDNTGKTTRLIYAKSGVTWLDFTATPSAHGQIRYATGAGGSAQTYAYDRGGRLVRVDDAYQGACTVRLYTFDLNSNRTQLDTHADAGDGVCTTATTPATDIHSYDTADRINDSGYSYDQLGRTLTVPGAQVAGATDLTIGYYANDRVASLSQGTATKTFTLDPAGRFRTATDVGGSRPGTVINHYDANTDQPAWIAEHDGTWTRNIVDLAGSLAAIQKSDGTAELQLTNLHGDVIATVPDDAGALGITTYFEQTEYGAPRAENLLDPARYGWLGGHLRSVDALAGVVLMGARVYVPGTGRFLSIDPVVGGTPNAYTYPVDPVNSFDTTGMADYCYWYCPSGWRLIRDTGWTFMRIVDYGSGWSYLLNDL